MKIFFLGTRISIFNHPLPTNCFLITHFFFTSTHSLFVLQFIFLYFYLDFISSTCLPPLSLISFQISKSQTYLLTFGQSSCGHPKKNSLRNSKDIKKRRRRRRRRRLEEHRHCRDHEEKWKGKQKRDRDTRGMHQIVKFVEKLSQVCEKLQRNLCTVCPV